MKYRRLLRFHNLKKPKIRQTWNKHNLFNLSRWKPNNWVTANTFFQQKWYAKSLTRGYHGDHIKEHQWERMFSRRLLSVVNMKPEYLAKFDGSEQAAGRGSGLQKPEEESKAGDSTSRVRTLYMQMAFATQERRLDVAIFRALFASSARQARQMVVHGAVKVNGIKMKYPGYQLNPGDMFQVDIDKVLLATGRPKLPASKAPISKKRQAAAKEAEEVEEEATEDVEAAAETAEKPEAEQASEELTEEEALKRERKRLKGFLAKARAVAYGKSSRKISAKKKKDLRELVRIVREEFARAHKANATSLKVTDITTHLNAMLERLSLTPEEQQALAEREQAELEELQREEQAALEAIEKAKREEAEKELAAIAADEEAAKNVAPETLAAEARAAARKAAKALKAAKVKAERERPLNKNEESLLKAYVRKELRNEFDPTKPYLTPWKPKEWMAPFAFIPRYLEVNQKICAAVYLRHPVARPGKAEVPTPFPEWINQLAFNWYLRRG